VGPIEGVLEIRYRTSTCADAGLDLEQYAENIGMVRRAVQTFAGPRNYDLVSATVGRTVLEAAPNGRFTVTLDGIGPDTVTLVLKVQANAAEPLTLEFPSGQEYDVSVRDASGQSVYTWSASRSFLQALHNVTVDREWSATVTIPRPPAGSYTVQAWLTTSGGTPAFAATVPLTLVR
jgi:hypothetical protein